MKKTTTSKTSAVTKKAAPKKVEKKAEPVPVKKGETFTVGKKTYVATGKTKDGAPIAVPVKKAAKKPVAKKPAAKKVAPKKPAAKKEDKANVPAFILSGGFTAPKPAPASPITTVPGTISFSEFARAEERAHHIKTPASKWVVG